jgi:hypothetical protein
MNCFSAAESWLWDMDISTTNPTTNLPQAIGQSFIGNTNDDKYNYRASHCPQCHNLYGPIDALKWPAEVFTDINNAMGHPNVEGASQYANAIESVIQRKGLKWLDGVPPLVQALQVTPLSLTSGESFTIDYTVSDSGGSGLKQVELWRTQEKDIWPEDPIQTNALAGENGPISGSFTDSPLAPGKYWYGVHVVDNAGNWNDERNSNTNGQPSSFEPAEVEVTSSQEVTLTLYVHDGSADGPVLSGVDVTGQDAAGNSFQQVTDSNGYATVEGEPGTWSFSVSAFGYETSSWSQSIAMTCTKHAFLQKTLTITPTSSAIIHASIWTVSETGPTGNCPGTWTRRPGTDTFDASWSCEGGVTDTIDITSVDGNKIALHRRGINGDYTGTISPNGTSISGTGSWFKAGTKWLVSIPKAVTITPTSFAVIHTSIWTVQEIGPMGNYNGTWTRRPGTNIFDASWNGGSITDVIDITSIEGNNITLYRHGANGYYTGTISPDGTSISGTGSWFRAG